MASVVHPWCSMTGRLGFCRGSFVAAVASSVNLIGTIRSVYLKGLGTGVGGEHSAGRRGACAAGWARWQTLASVT